MPSKRDKGDSGFYKKAKKMPEKKKKREDDLDHLADEIDTEDWKTYQSANVGPN